MKRLKHCRYCSKEIDEKANSGITVQIGAGSTGTMKNRRICFMCRV